MALRSTIQATSPAPQGIAVLHYGQATITLSLDIDEPLRRDGDEERTKKATPLTSPSRKPRMALRSILTVALSSMQVKHLYYSPYFTKGVVANEDLYLTWGAVHFKYLVHVPDTMSQAVNGKRPLADDEMNRLFDALMTEMQERFQAPDPLLKPARAVS